MTREFEGHCKIKSRDLSFDGKVFGDKGCIKQKFLENLFNQGSQLVYGFKSNMKKRAYALVGQNDAAQAIYNRMHQRSAQEQAPACPFTPSLRT